MMNQLVNIQQISKSNKELAGMLAIGLVEQFNKLYYNQTVKFNTLGDSYIYISPMCRLYYYIPRQEVSIWCNHSHMKSQLMQHACGPRVGIEGRIYKQAMEFHIENKGDALNVLQALKHIITQPEKYTNEITD